VREPIELASILEDACFTGADLRVYLHDRPSGARALEAHGAFPLTLGGRVLRAETAVFTGLALVQHAYGDL